VQACRANWPNGIAHAQNARVVEQVPAAYALLKRGHEVTVIDRNTVAILKDECKMHHRTQ